VNPLSGGQKLEAYLRKVAQRVQNPGTLNVGFLEGATYPDGTSVPLVAAVDEFGSSRSPPRPYFRNMIAEKHGEWGPALGAILKANDYDANAALNQMGEGIKGQLQQSIADFDSVPLAPSTIKAKGSDKQLVEAGHLMNSADYEVIR